MDCEQPKRVTDQTCTYFRMYTFLCYLSEFEGLGLRNVYHPGHTFACRTWLYGECSHVDAVGTMNKPEVGGLVVLYIGVCEVLSITASSPSNVFKTDTVPSCDKNDLSFAAPRKLSLGFSDQYIYDSGRRKIQSLYSSIQTLRLDVTRPDDRAEVTPIDSITRSTNLSTCTDNPAFCK